MQLTLQQKIGQKLVTGFPVGTLGEDFINAVKKHKIGNVILFKENVTSDEQLKKLCEDIHKLILQETGFPPFITIDQEGGSVTRMPVTAANVPGAMAVAATDNPQNAYDAGYITGCELLHYGINFDLAPVVDVNSNPKNPIIGARSYGDTPEKVTKYACNMMKGLTDAGVLASVKHFPGHGDTDTDSHLALPCVDKSRQELEKTEFVPFKEAIKQGAPAVMTTHILFPQLDNSGVPATMSRIILTDILRKEMGFEGLIVSDCMEMKAIADNYTTVGGVKAAFKAGVDLAFVSHDAALAGVAAEEALKAAEAEEISIAELDESVERILQFKKHLKTWPPIYDRAAAKKTALDMLANSLSAFNIPKGGFNLGASPLCVGCPAVRITLVGNVQDNSKSFGEIIAPMINGKPMRFNVNPANEEIAEIVNAAQGHSSVVIGTYNAHINTAQLKLVTELSKLSIPVAAVALRNPYDLIGMPKNVYTLAAYEYTQQSIHAAAEVLCGKKTAGGKIPITL